MNSAEYAGRLAGIQERIARAAESVGRDPASISLIAVSKFHPVSAIQALYDLGHREFGESRLQEAEPKIAELPKNIEWHFIGKLQSNKVKRVIEEFDCVHTFETSSQLASAAKAEGAVRAFVEVNIAKEVQKTGIFADALDDYIQKLIQCQQVRFQGLMTIGPAFEDAEQMRPYFAELRRLNERVGGKSLSMGMSHDFEVAIQEGATHIRVGTALFGVRAS